MSPIDLAWGFGCRLPLLHAEAAADSSAWDRGGCRTGFVLYIFFRLLSMDWAEIVAGCGFGVGWVLPLLLLLGKDLLFYRQLERWQWPAAIIFLQLPISDVNIRQRQLHHPRVGISNAFSILRIWILITEVKKLKQYSAAATSWPWVNLGDMLQPFQSSSNFVYIRYIFSIR